jgi:phytoene dehydrogenase-like protein
MSEVLIVGGGICGLQLGALLATEGDKVRVVEKLTRVGGRAFIWDKDGFSVDNGVHLIRFGEKSAMAQVFRRLGAPLDFAELGKSYVGFPDGRVLDFPTTPKGFLTTKLMSVTERLKTLGVLIKLRKANPGEYYNESVKDWMDHTGFTDGVRRYLHLVTASMQVCPFLERASAGELMENMKAVLEKRRSAMYPVQGWPYIYETIERAIRRAGEIRTGAKVKRVIIEGGRARGVELEGGERLTADRVVINLPVQQLFEILDETLVPADFAARCKNLTPTAGVVLDYGLTERVSNDTGLWYLWDPMSFGVFTSNLRPEVAPPGKQLLTWFLPANVSDMSDPERAKQLEQALETAIFRVFPGLERAIEWRRAMHLTMVDGVEVNVKQHRLLRPGNRVPGIAGLFLVGDSLSAPGAGGDVGHESVLGCYHEMTGKKVEG